MSSIYRDRVTRICPPRDVTTGAGSVRAVACNVSTTSVEIDNDIFQMATVNAAANAAADPGSYGRGLMECYADGNDLYINFGPLSSVVANSAATSGNTQAWCLPKGATQFYEIDPKVDKFFSARTINGNTLTATLRYRIRSFPTQGLPGSG